jgi:hypothetical protein
MLAGKTDPLVLGTIYGIAELDPTTGFLLVRPLVPLVQGPYDYLAQPARVFDDLGFKWQEEGRGP